MPPNLAPPTHVLETCLYVRSKSESDRFYRDVLGLGEPSPCSERISVYPLGDTTLILFQLGLTHQEQYPNGTPDNRLPGHGPTPGLVQQLKPEAGQGLAVEGLKQHYCLGVPSREDVERWEKHFEDSGVETLGVMEWERGGRSVYFADPDGHVGEIASRGLWSHY